MYSVSEKFLKTQELYIYNWRTVPGQARIQGGGGQGCLGPPPFSGGKNKGAKNHTHRRKKDQNRTNHEARYRLKRTTKHTKYAKIFKKKFL